MITLITILIIWGIISLYRINKISKQNNKPFHLANGTFIDLVGFVLGIGVTSITIMGLIIQYLP